jgi:hypothetical protein
MTALHYQPQSEYQPVLFDLAVFISQQQTEVQAPRLLDTA